MSIFDHDPLAIGEPIKDVLKNDDEFDMLQDALSTFGSFDFDPTMPGTGALTIDYDRGPSDIMDLFDEPEIDPSPTPEAEAEAQALQAAEEAKRALEIDISNRSQKIYEALNSFSGPLQRKFIEEALEGFPPGNQEALKKDFHDHYDLDLMEKLQSHLGNGMNMRVVEQLLAGNPLAHEARDIIQQFRRPSPDSDVIGAILLEKKEDRATLLATIKEMGGVSFKDLCERNLRGTDLAVIKELLAGNDLALEAKGALECLQRSPTCEEFGEFILGKSPEDREELIFTMQRFGDKHIIALVKEAFTGTELKFANELVSGNELALEAKAALEAIHRKDLDTLQEILLRNKENQDSLLETIQYVTEKDITAHLESSMDGPQLKAALELLKGNAHALEALRAVECLDQGIDVPFIGRVGGPSCQEFGAFLKSKSPEEREAFLRTMKAIDDKDIDTRVEEAFDGADLKAIKAFLAGNELALEAKALFDAMDGLGTNEEKVHEILSGKSDAEREALKEMYKKITGESLKDALEGDFEGVELNFVNALLDGNELALEAKALFDAMDGLGTDEEKVYEILSGKSDAEREKLKAMYKKITGESLKDALEGDFEGVELEVVNALLDGKEFVLEAKALYDAMDGLGTDAEKVYEILSGKSDAEREALKEAYKRITGVSLEEDLEGDFEGVELEVVNALLEGKEFVLEAKALFDAMDGLGTDEEKVYEILSGKSDAEREALKTMYEKITGSTLEYDLAHELSGVHLDKAMDLLNTGEVSDVVLIRLAVEGIGTDEKALFALLRSCDQERLEQLKAGYKERYKEGLEERLIDELSMREELEAKIALMGQPTTPEERIKQIQLRMDYAEGLLAEIYHGTLFEFTTGESLRRNVEGAVSLLDVYRNDNDHDSSLSKKEQEEIDVLLRYAELDLDTLKRNAGRIRPKPSPQEENKVEEITP